MSKIWIYVIECESVTEFRSWKLESAPHTIEVVTVVDRHPLVEAYPIHSTIV